MNRLLDQRLKARRKLIFQQPRVLGQYDPVNLQRAFDATQGGMSVYRASRTFGIPESTLRDRTRGNVDVDARPGSETLFSVEEERQLVDHVKYMSSIGYGYSKLNVQYLAVDFAVSCGKRSRNDKPLSDRWFYGMLSRWPDLRVAKPQKPSMLRAQCASRETLDAYFKELATILTLNDLHDKPERIYNMDETGINTEHAPPKVVCDASCPPQAITSPRSSTVTIIGGGNALGNYIPPYFVFPGKRWNDQFLEGAPPGSAGEMSDSGWSNTDIFHKYLTVHFAKYAGITEDEKSPKTLVLFDGHKSHITLTLIDWAKKHNVILFVLPPHTSHITQPLDVAVFGPFKSLYSKECQLYMQRNPGVKISKYEVAKLVSKPYLRAMSVDNLMSAFRKCGIFPFSNKTVEDFLVAPSTIYACEESSDTAEKENKPDSSAALPLNCGDGQTRRTPTPQPSDTNFFESRTIKKVTATKRKRFVPPFIAGSLLKAKNIKVLSQSALNVQKKTFKAVKGHIQTTQEVKIPEARQTSTQAEKSKLGPTNSPQPGPSTYHLDSDSDSFDSQISSEEDASENCCVCGKNTPPALRSHNGLVIVKWAQCDVCQHWTHLRFCSAVTCEKTQPILLSTLPIDIKQLELTFTFTRSPYKLCSYC